MFLIVLRRGEENRNKKINISRNEPVLQKSGCDINRSLKQSRSGHCKLKQELSSPRSQPVTKPYKHRITISTFFYVNAQSYPDTRLPYQTRCEKKCFASCSATRSRGANKTVKSIHRLCSIPLMIPSSTPSLATGSESAQSR